MRTNALRHFAAWAALGSLLAGAGCARKGGGAAAQAAPQANPGERTFALSGEVLKVDAKAKILTVRHNEVVGYMPAMTMEFPVSAGDAAVARPGERIRADLVVDAAGKVRLENVWPDDKVALDTIDAGERMLRQDTFEKGASAFREVGEKAPDFVLYDQDGRVVSSARFRGKQVMLNFIYSRCPVANMCPLSTTKMMETQKLAREAGIAGVEFVSITLDPAHDTPGVLREYADDRKIDTSNFSFLTGPEPAIRDLLTQFGVIAEFKGGILDHTLATLLIDPSGRVAWRADGSQWEPGEFLGRMRK
ncbi:MAG TPA: SCO family protein [Opitutaceae bacterium]